MERGHSVSDLDMVEVDIDADGELDDFTSGSPPGAMRRAARAARQRQPAFGAMWLFVWNAVMPLAIVALTTANAVVVAGNGTLLPWLDNGQSLGLLHAGMFFAVLGLWAVVTCLHRQWRARGYLTFYRTTRGIKDAPLLAVGVGNGASACIRTNGYRKLFPRFAWQTPHAPLVTTAPAFCVLCAAGWCVAPFGHACVASRSSRVSVDHLAEWGVAVDGPQRVDLHHRCVRVRRAVVQSIHLHRRWHRSLQPQAQTINNHNNECCPVVREFAVLREIQVCVCVCVCRVCVRACAPKALTSSSSSWRS
jgi:hypothetical protein